MIKRYIFRELALTSFFIFLLTMVVIFIIIFYQTFKINYGLGIDVLLRIAPPVAGWTLPIVLIISSVLGATLCYSRLSSDNEINAMKTTGFHSMSLIYPSVAWGIILAAASVVTNEFIVPRSLTEQKRIAKEEMYYMFRNPPPSKQAFLIGLQYLVSYSQASGRVLKNVIIEEKKIEEGRPEIKEIKTYFAPEGIIEDTPDGQIRIRLKDFLLRIERTEKGGSNWVSWGGGQEAAQDLPPLELPGGERLAQRSKYLSGDELLAVAYGNFEEKDRIKAFTEYHVRYANSLALFGLVVVSSLFGIFVRSSSRLAGIGATIPILVLFLVFSKQFEGLALVGKTSAFAVYIPPIALLVLAVILYVRIRK